eukprot:1086113-Pyramimonas_sp.AAC.1
MSANPSRGSRPLPSRSFSACVARARQCPRLRARRRAESPRRAPVAPEGSRRRARVVRCAE